MKHEDFETYIDELEHEALDWNSEFCFSCTEYIGPPESVENYDGLCRECEMFSFYVYENYEKE